MVRINSLRCWWITAQSHEQPRIGRWRLTAVRSARDSGDREQRVGCRHAFMLDIHGGRELRDVAACLGWQRNALPDVRGIARSEEQPSELRSLMRSSYAIICL